MSDSSDFRIFKQRKPALVKQVTWERQRLLHKMLPEQIKVCRVYDRYSFTRKQEGG